MSRRCSAARPCTTAAAAHGDVVTDSRFIEAEEGRRRDRHGFIGDDGADRVVAGFGRENYDRLATIKAEFDPDRVFNRWHNIAPNKPAVTT